MHHIARLARTVDSQLFDHAREDQVGLIRSAMQTRDQQDRIDVLWHHTGIPERENGNSCERLDKTAVRKFSCRDFSNAHEYRVIFLPRIDVQLPIFHHSNSPLCEHGLEERHHFVPRLIAN